MRGEIDRSHSGPPVALPKGVRVIGKGPFTAIFVAWFVALMATPFVPVVGVYLSLLVLVATFGVLVGDVPYH